MEGETAYENAVYSITVAIIFENKVESSLCVTVQFVKMIREINPKSETTEKSSETLNKCVRKWLVFKVYDVLCPSLLLNCMRKCWKGGKKQRSLILISQGQ